jgi:hypothetical protein
MGVAASRPAMRTRFLPFLCLLLVACTHPNGCGEDIYADSGGTRDTPPSSSTTSGRCGTKGGRCLAIFCDGTIDPSGDDDCGFLAGCCVERPSTPPPFPPPPSFTPQPAEESSCNGQKCAPGCVCRPVQDDAGVCDAVCDCPLGPPPDAGDDDAGDAGAPGTGHHTCGEIQCDDACECQSQALSVCTCFSSACGP